MPNKDNLVPLTTKKAREIGRKGGIASGKAKRAKKTAFEITKMFLDEKIDVHGQKLDRKQLMLTNAWKRVNNALMASGNKALTADELKSLDYILQLVGEAPIPKTQQEITVATPIQIIDDVDTDTKPEGTE